MAKSFSARMKDRFQKITTDYGKINQYVHETAMMILEHANEHKDCSIANDLIMAMPASNRREMLILWFSMFSPIVVKNSDSWTAKMHKEGTKLYVPFDLEGAAATPWFELANKNKEKAPLAVEDIVKLIERLASTLEKKAESDGVEADTITSALDVARQLRSIKVPKPVTDNTNGEEAVSTKAKAA